MDEEHANDGYDTPNQIRLKTKAEGVAIDITLSRTEIERLLTEGSIRLTNGDDDSHFSSQILLSDSNGEQHDLCRLEIHRGA